jgi:transcriptional regulator with XRE-family HTH domain
MNVDYKLIGERIKKTRKLNGITQDVLAEKLGVSIGYVSQVERGITKISLDLLGAISSILDCDIESFITESATNSSEYMESELLFEIRKLNSKKKKYILEIIKLTNETI